MKNPIFKKWWFWFIAVIVLAVLFVIIGKYSGDENTVKDSAETAAAETSEEIESEALAATTDKATEQIQAQQATQSPTDKPPAVEDETTEYTTYPDGFYKIGEDMPAGEYKLFAYENTDGASYYEVAADDTGEFSDFIASGNYPNFIYVTVADGQYFGFDDGYAVPAGEAATYDTAEGIHIPGMYKVGVDIPAGEYKLIYDSNYAGYYEICSDSSHTPESIIESGNFTGDIYVTVADGEYIYFTGAYIEGD